MRIVVTGAGSYIGGVFATLCRAEGIDVIGIDARADEGSADWHVTDIRSPDIADLVPEGVDGIVHLAALSRDPDCSDKAMACFDVNVMGTLNLIEIAKARKARGFVFASSEWVYDSFEPGVEKTEEAQVDAARLLSEYALSKFVSENNLRQQAAHGFCPVAALRFGIVYGPRRKNWSAVEALLNTVATSEDVQVGSCATARRFIHVNDVAEGILSALRQTRQYEIFNIQGPSLVTLGEVIEHASDVLGRTVRVVETDPEMPSVRRVSSEKASKELGWTARIGIREGMIGVARHLGYTIVAE